MLFYLLWISWVGQSIKVDLYVPHHFLSSASLEVYLISCATSTSMTQNTWGVCNLIRLKMSSTSYCCNMFFYRCIKNALTAPPLKWNQFFRTPWATNVEVGFYFLLQTQQKHNCKQLFTFIYFLLPRIHFWPQPQHKGRFQYLLFSFPNLNLNYQHEHKYEQLLEEAKKLELDASSCCLLKGFQSFYFILFTWCLILTPPQSGRALCKRWFQSDWQGSSGENSGWILPPTLQVFPFQIF